MRFSENGPAIPNELIAARNDGEVVLFCGAGVSKPAGLPGFFDLTKQLMAKFGVAPDSKAGQIMAPALANDDPELAPPLDQVIGVLQREYGAKRVETEVLELLKVGKRPLLRHHRNLLAISSGMDGDPLLVTTNFDALFERSRRGIRTWTLPNFPSDIGSSGARGLVYLHGAPAGKTDDTKGSLVLSASDFGRAYLAEGWCTDFMRRLLQRRIVVLVGYSASDPPVRYLLEGLQAIGSVRLKPIYAFDRGYPAEVVPKWRELGVVGIPFSHFDELWDTIQKWAEQSHDLAAWTHQCASLSQRSPQTLKPFERGQVAALVATAKGAKAFSLLNPPPPSEWLFVFDRYQRLAETQTDGYGADAKKIEPQHLYGLDDDSVRDDGEESGKSVGMDVIESNHGDDDIPYYTRLSGNPVRRGHIPRRLSSLTWWFERVSHEQAAVWWTSHQANIHPELLWGVGRRLTGHGEKYDDDAWRTWRSLYKALSESGGSDSDLRWYDFQARLNRDGWTEVTLAELADLWTPRLRIDRPLRNRALPSNAAALSSLISLKVNLPNLHNANVDVPDRAVPAVFRLLRSALERCIPLLNQTSAAHYFHLPAISPDGRPGERYFDNEGPIPTFLWAVSLFERLANLQPDLARREANSWLSDDRYFFDKLRVFAWSRARLFTMADVVAGLSALSDRSFWDPYLQREILQLLKQRWRGFRQADRQQVEGRISKGPPRYRKESRADFNLRREFSVAERLGWLSDNGTKLSRSALTALKQARKRAGWEKIGQGADHDLDGRTGWVEQRKDPASLTTLPPKDILAAASKASSRPFGAFVEYAPFAGLVAEAPLRALSALRLEAKAARFTQSFWETLLREWPQQAKPRLTWLLARSLMLLKSDDVAALRFPISSWLEGRFESLLRFDEPTAWAMWDQVFQSVAVGDESVSRSSVLDEHASRVQGKTVNHAFNSPIGRLIETLFELLRKRNPKRGSRIPLEMRVRFERTIGANQLSAQYAATLLAWRLNWLTYVDPRWTKSIVVPWLVGESNLSEAAWNGVLFGGRLPSPASLFKLVRQDFLRLFSQQGTGIEAAELDRKAAELLVLAGFWGQTKGEYLRTEECRAALRSTTESARHAAIWMAGKVLADTASIDFVRTFFAEIWPQEAVFQTAGSSDVMVRMADNNPAHFGELVDLIVDHLRPVDHPDLFTFRHRQDPKSLVERWPLKVLAVADCIIADRPRIAPYELGNLLEDIAEQVPSARETRAWRRLKDIVQS